MSMTLYYLSATGNSLQMAKELALQLNTEETVRLISVPDALKNGDLHPIGPVGFVFPLHFFALPLLAETFLAKIDLTQADYTFSIVTSGFHYISSAFAELSLLVEKAGGSLNAAFYIDMISVYLPLSDLPSKRKTEKKLLAAKKRLAKIATRIHQRDNVHPIEFLSWPSKVMHQMVQKHPEKLDEEFMSMPSCSGCGLCVQICPKQNIHLNDQHVPVWHHECTQCLACLHACPTQAIEIGQKTQGKRRYRHPQITLKELLPTEKD